MKSADYAKITCAVDHRLARCAGKDLHLTKDERYEEADPPQVHLA